MHAAARKGYRDRGLTLTRRVSIPETALGSAAFLLLTDHRACRGSERLSRRPLTGYFYLLCPQNRPHSSPAVHFQKSANTRGVSRRQGRGTTTLVRQSAPKCSVMRSGSMRKARSCIVNGSIGDWVSRLRTCCEISPGERRPTISQAEAIDNLFAGLAEVIREQAWPENIFSK